MKCFWKGFLSIFNLGCDANIQNKLDDILESSKNGFEKDRDNIRGDWNNVGSDLRNAINKL